MNPTLLAIIELLLGTAENVIPLFIHNPKSNAVEGVIATVLNSVVPQLPAIMAPTPTAPAPTLGNTAPASAGGIAGAHGPLGGAVYPSK